MPKPKSNKPEFDADILKLITRSRVFAGLSARDLTLALEIMKPVFVEHTRGQMIWNVGDPLNRLAVVASGRVASYQQTSSAHKQLIRFYETGQIVALEAFASHKRTSHTMILSHRSGELLLLNLTRAFDSDKLSQRTRQKLLQNVLNAVADESIRFINKSLMVSLISVKDRVMVFLKKIHARESGEPFDIGMSQDEFAQYLAVDRSSLAVALNKLRREGRIEYRGSVYHVLEE